MSEDAAVYKAGGRYPVDVSSIDLSSLSQVQSEVLKQCMDLCQWYTRFGNGDIVFGYQEETVVLVLAGDWVASIEHEEKLKFRIKDFDFDNGKVRKFMRSDAVVEIVKK